MTAQEIIDVSKVEIDQQETPGTFTDPEFLSILNEGYTDFLRFTAIRQKDTQTTVAALQSLVPLPNDFLEATETRWSYNRQLYTKDDRGLDYDQKGWVFECGVPVNYVYRPPFSIRLKPIPTSAGTVRFRHRYFPSALTLTSTPDIPDIYHSSLSDFVSAMCFFVMREYDNGLKYWQSYDERRKLARGQSRQGTPDTLQSQRPTSVYNYGLWDQGYRIR